MTTDNNPSNTAWDDTAKAQWILENGDSSLTWIFERVGEQVYKRPMGQPGKDFPPWINTNRIPIYKKHT